MTVGSTINYTTLVASKSTAGSIANWLNHADVQSAAPTIIAEAEAAIYRDLRHWRMIASTAGTMTSNPGGQPTVVDYVPLPADYLEDRVFYVTGVNYQKMTRKTMEEVIASYAYDGSGYRQVQQPMWYFSDATNLKFDSAPDQAYPYLLYYYCQPTALGATNLTNFITQFYPRLLRCATCAAAAEFMKDAGQGNYDRTYWEQNFMAEMEKAQIESDRSVRSQDIGMIIT